jgi:hypothetical protein
MFRRLIAAAFAVLVVAIPARAAEPVFSDSFQNLNKWTKAQGAAPQLGQLEAGDKVAPCLLLGNGVAKADLPQKISDSFVLSFLAINNDYQRGLWVGLFNEDGSKGYAALWDSSSKENFHGQGSVAITKFDLPKPVTFADQVGSVLTERVESGHKAIDGWPAKIELSWDKPSRTLRLSVNGVEKCRVVDASLNSFSRIYLRGNERSLFADLRLNANQKTETTKPPR